MKTIETERLSLLEVTPEVYQELFLTRQEEELRDIMGIYTDKDWATERQRYEQGRTGFGRSFVNFYIKEKTLGKTIGSCGFHTWYTAHSRAEIGYALAGDQWKRQGYMKEALSPVVRYGYETMQLNRIEAFVGTQNTASQKLLLGLGFQLEGQMKEHYCKDGVIEDSLVYALLRKEFETQKKY